MNFKQKYVFLFEYELLNTLDLISIFLFIIRYPFRQFELLQHNKSEMDMHFNYEIFNCLNHTSFEAYTRYLVAKRVLKKNLAISTIVSWQEFQNLEKTFYKAIRESNSDIFIYGCEFLVKYRAYPGMNITNIDVDMGITPNVTLLNGLYNYSSCSRHFFKTGVSLRYANLFAYLGVEQEKGMPLILLSYDINESINLLKKLTNIRKASVKIHPATLVDQFKPYINDEWIFINSDIYTQFKKTNLIFVAPMSGVALEAVACGVTVIIVASKDRVMMNPFLDYGKGKIWDVAYDQKEVETVYNDLINFRKYNSKEIGDIGKWYKDSFFIEPTEENISKAFKLT